jgi:hypothetical protein
MQAGPAPPGQHASHGPAPATPSPASPGTHPPTVTVIPRRNPFGPAPFSSPSGPGKHDSPGGPGFPGSQAGQFADGQAPDGQVSAGRPGRRGRRMTTMFAAAAGLVLVIGAALVIGARLSPHGTASGTSPGSRSPGGPAGAAAPGVFGVRTVTQGCPAASVRGAAAQCPAARECWDGLVGLGAQLPEPKEMGAHRAVVAGALASIERAGCEGWGQAGGAAGLAGRSAVWPGNAVPAMWSSSCPRGRAGGG